MKILKIFSILPLSLVKFCISQISVSGNLTDLFLELKVYFSTYLPFYYPFFFNLWSGLLFVRSYVLSMTRRCWHQMTHDLSSLFQQLRCSSVLLQSQKRHQGQKCHILHLVNVFFHIWAKCILSHSAAMKHESQWMGGQYFAYVHIPFCIIHDKTISNVS